MQETDEWDASLAPEVHDYPQVLRDLGTSILLVAATYDATTTEHVCSITEA